MIERDYNRLYAIELRRRLKLDTCVLPARSPQIQYFNVCWLIAFTSAYPNQGSETSLSKCEWGLQSVQLRTKIEEYEKKTV